MVKVTSKLVEIFIANGIISDDDKDIYFFGLNQGIALVLNFITTILIGCMFNMALESIIYLLAYMPLRSYAGGYHSKTPFRCYVFSIVIIIISFYIITLPIWTLWIMIAVVLISTGIVILLAPVESAKKPLDQLEKLVYKKQSHRILFILVGLIAFFWFIGQQQISICIAVAIFALSMLLILGKIVKH